MLRLIAFGGLALERDGQPVGGAAAQRRRLALLAYLAVAGARGVSRDRIVALLWPESDAQRARHLLAQTLSVLRHELGHEDVILGTTELRLNPAVLTSHVGDFLDALDRGDLETAVSLYRRPLRFNARFAQLVRRMRLDWREYITQVMKCKEPL